MKSQILIGASEFMTALSARAQEAKESLYVQAMIGMSMPSTIHFLNRWLNSHGQECLVIAYSGPVQTKHLRWCPGELYMLVQGAQHLTSIVLPKNLANT